MKPAERQSAKQLLNALEPAAFERVAQRLTRIKLRSTFSPSGCQFVSSGIGAADCPAALTSQRLSSHITSMALSRKKATTIALDPEDDRLLSHAARERGISRSEFVRQHLALVLEQYRRHPKPRSAGIVGALADRGDERELFGGGR